MIWLRTWHLGVKSLLLHPMRSLLTVLGIFIGVASVIWLVAISEGISQKAQEQIEGLGAENIIVRSMKPPDDSDAGVGYTPATKYGVTRDDFDHLVTTVPHIESALPIRELPYKFSGPESSTPVVINGRLVGCTPEYAEVTHLKISRGHFLTDAEVRDKATHCVLAARLTEELFPYEDPIGRRLYIPERQDYYAIVGVLQHRTPTAAIGGSLAAQDFSYDVYIPITTMRQRIGDEVIKRSAGSFSRTIFELSQITLRVDDVSNVKRTAALVEDTLSDKHTNQDVATIVPIELIEQAENTKLMFMWFMGLIAAISLVVGGIGIMNIMLATVTERTREIGIRRSLGARRVSIIYQFLAETVLLSVVGGISGILFGLLCPPIIESVRYVALSFRPDIVAGLPDVVRTMTPVVVPLSIPLAFVISVAVGVLFGIYPAIRAAHLDPIEALRHE